MGSRPSTRLIQFPNSKPHAATGSAAKFNGVLSVIALRRHDKALHVLQREARGNPNRIESVGINTGSARYSLRLPC
jgi:hypothetical protein